MSATCYPKGDVQNAFVISNQAHVSYALSLFETEGNFQFCADVNVKFAPSSCQRYSQFSIKPFISSNHSLLVTGILTKRSYIRATKTWHIRLNRLSQTDTEKLKTSSRVEELHPCARLYKVRANCVSGGIRCGSLGIGILNKSCQIPSRIQSKVPRSTRSFLLNFSLVDDWYPSPIL